VNIMSRSVGAPVAPDADAARVAAIRNSIDLRDKSTLETFGERARREVGASISRLHAEATGRELSDVSDALRRAAEAARGLDPSLLTPTGMANLFGGRKRRLNWFRGKFETAAKTLDAVTAELRDRSHKIEKKSQSLNTLHEQARGFILELDAHLAAGKARGVEVVNQGGERAAEAVERLTRRIGDLEGLRATAVEQLPLVRMVQNVDAPVGEAVERAAAAIAAWKTDWSERLGMQLDPRMRLRPDEAGLERAKARLLDSLASTDAVLAEARTRRSEAETEMEKAAKLAKA
jgi:uncharacterized protein YaaN involved in tellurite resistance